MAVDVNAEFYYDEYCGEEFDDIDRLLKRAINVIDSIISDTPFGAVQEKAYRMAVCSEAEYIGMSGGVSAWVSATTGSASSFTIGSFSMSGGANSRSGERMTAKTVCDSALDYLSNAGLIYRGVDCR